MRIIAGSLGGRNFNSPRGHKTHPMSEKMRGALFNALGELDGLDVLDAYGGSGAMSFEAISRGARSAVCIDVDRDAYDCIRQNIATLRVRDIQVVRANAASWSQNNPDALFDLVICDPPYDDIKQSQLQQLATHVASGGLFVASLPKDYTRPIFSGFVYERDKAYADGSLVLYRRS